MTDLPVACCLPPADLAEREREIRALFTDALEAVRREPRRLELRFADGASARVEALAEAERRCCAFLTFETIGSGLVIEAPAGAEDTLDGFASVARETLRR
jgi:hypothetical protein